MLTLNINRLKKQSLYILLIILFIVVNFLASFLKLRLDLSFGKAYTLSPSTRKIITKLKKPVKISFYVSSDLPARLIPLKTEISDTLDEYKKQGGKNIIFKTKDPKKDNKILEEVRKVGLQELRFSELEGNRYQTAAVFFGLVVDYRGKTEVINQATDIDNLEYNLTAAIYKLTRENTPKVAIIGEKNGFGSSNDPLLSLKKLLNKQFELSFFNFGSKKTEKIDKEIKTILVFDSNNKTYSDEEIKKIGDYLDQGGKGIFFLSGVWVDDQLATAPAKNNFSSFLSKWGVKLNKDLVLSGSSELVSFGMGGGSTIFTPYPFWVKAADFNRSKAYFSNVNQLTFPWVSSLKLSEKAGFKISPLVKTSARSWHQEGVFNLSPNSIPRPRRDSLQNFLIAAEAESENGGKIVVIPSSRFILQRYLGRDSSNLEFILNLVNDLASGGVLSGIRSRSVATYPLPDLNENQKDIFRYTNILILPFLFSIYGMVRLARRKKVA